MKVGEMCDAKRHQRVLAKAKRLDIIFVSGGFSDVEAAVVKVCQVLSSGGPTQRKTASKHRFGTYSKQKQKQKQKRIYTYVHLC